MGQTEKIIAGLEPPALEGLTRAPFPAPVEEPFFVQVCFVFEILQIKWYVSCQF